MGIVDFTNPQAVTWYQGHLRRLMAEGVDCFKTDFGERIPADGVYYDGSDPLKMHNYYTQLFNKAVFEVVEEVKGKNEAVLFARSATAGGQQYPVHWGGDCDSNYESMAESLRGGLSLSVCGFGFWSHDISGFENTATPDVYKRWVAFGLFSSHSRLHGSSSYRVPWNFDDEASEVVRFFTRFKCKLMPYIYAASVVAHETGIPVMRPMVMDFAHDPVCLTLDRQYMFGPDILVAPVFNPEGKTLTYIPEGVWTHLITGRQVTGGRYLEEENDYFELPVYVRPNSLIATGADDNFTEGKTISAAYDYHEKPVIHAYEINEKGAEAAIVDKYGKLRYTVRVVKVNGEMKITAEGRHDGFTVMFYGNDEQTVEITV
jgi:alpha-D-xyloside xylohydrolase